MTQNKTSMKKDLKLRLTAFVDPMLVKRAKVRGALEGLTISEVVEKALDAYAPKLEKGTNQQIHVKFFNYPANDSLLLVPKHTKSLAAPR
jgi:hypothetical protein